MKKIFIVALIGAMLMPAQMLAGNDRGRKERPRVEKRDGKKGGGKEQRGYNSHRGGERGRKGEKVVIVNRVQRPIIVNNCPPRYCPPPPPPHRHHHCHNDVADAIGAAAAMIGLIGIVSAIAQ